MGDRQSTPDIMASLMDMGAEKEESNKAIREVGNKTIKQPSNKAIKPDNNKAIQMRFDSMVEDVPTKLEEPKEKATFNLPVKLLRELEDKWMEIRKLSGSKQISKTLIVEKALELAFAEFDLKKQIGSFYSKLASNKAINTHSKREDL